MFIFSLKVTKVKLAAMAVVLVAVIALLFNFSNKTAAIPTMKVNTTASTNEERIAFLVAYGWQVKTEPTEVIDLIVPSTFDGVYEKYNVMQKAQGFDLTGYMGKRVKRYTYTVTNYPQQSSTTVNANLLVYEDKVIGGDVCSTELGGFIHGFSTNSN